MSTNVEDIERGRAILNSGERIRYNELSDGDEILGVGIVHDVRRKAVGMVYFKIEGYSGGAGVNAENFITIRSRDSK
jgi:hypothetical protein